MFIKFKQTGPNPKTVWNIANNVMLKTGDNEVKDSDWEQVKNHPRVLERLGSGVIRVSASEVESHEKSLAAAKERAEKKNDNRIDSIKKSEENNRAEERMRTEEEQRKAKASRPRR